MSRLHGEYKEPGQKLVVVDLELIENKISKAQVSGDFFLEPDEILVTLAESLTGLPADGSILEFESKIRGSLPADAQLFGITPHGLAIATKRAINEAHRWRELEWELVHTPQISPALNVALDEVLTRRVAAGIRKPTLRIWEWNSDAIIIGSFQSVMNEVDSAAAERHNAVILRRISGGGAMYMQSGASISYSIYIPSDFVTGMSFERSYEFLDDWALEALSNLGVDARYVPLNDIAGPQGKIGGAAQKRLASGAILHHATLAYDLDGERMNDVLRVGREKLSDKGIVSAVKRVDPLKTQTGLSRDEIQEELKSAFVRRSGATLAQLNHSELEEATSLTEDKFLTDGWLKRIP